ncbi:FF domain [Dillenia turbinata]|uniref:FF domain n=1 Tax=Dillenia turbinata TaxID=194707 RepID=A0AAN8ZQK0_9MAGN
MANNHQFPALQPPRQPIINSMIPAQGFNPPMPVQFRPMAPPQQPQPFVTQQYQPVGQGVPVMNSRLPPQPPPLQFPHTIRPLPTRPAQQLPAIPAQQLPAIPAQQLPARPAQSAQQLPTRPAQPGLGPPPPPPPPVPMPMPNAQPLRPIPPALPLSSSYTFAPPSYGPPQPNASAVTQYQPAPTIPAAGQPWPSKNSQSTGLITPVQQNVEHPVVTTTMETSIQSKPPGKVRSDWIEHNSSDGRRYYYNRRTKLSSWEKPYDLMTPIEVKMPLLLLLRADATTDWKEFTSPDGKKYYYNRVTKQSKWILPEELKVAREKLANPEMASNSLGGVSSVAVSVDKPPSVADSKRDEIASSPVAVAPVVAVFSQEHVENMESSLTAMVSSSVTEEVVGTKSPVGSVVQETAVLGSNRVPVATDNAAVPPLTNLNDSAPQEVKSVEGVSAGVIEAMRAIINDRKYGALKTLGERKQAFNEYLNQKKKQDAEERRAKQKKAREEFRKMLEECSELTSSTRWSKAISMFEEDERFKAVERSREREDLYEDYMEELEKQEKAKVHEEHKQNVAEYRQFLASCDFIKASSQWRKVQDRLEADERCSRLEKIDRLEIFQEYLHDLEKEEQEERKLQKEELRKGERKNRDDFRKLMEEHVASGILTAKSHWRDYCLKVKDLSAYLAISSNTSGSTPKDLFEDVSEELQNQYHDDKTHVKDAVKLAKITLSSTWTLEEFKAAILDDVSSPPVSDANLKLIFDELIERVKEKEEKEAKKCRRLADNFLDLLSSMKEITTTSKWESCAPLLEDKQEFRSIGKESFCRGVFEEYILRLKEKAKEEEWKKKEEKARKEKEKEEKERRKLKEKREKDRAHVKERGKERSKKDGADSEKTESNDTKDSKRSGKDKDKKHQQRHQSDVDEPSLDKNGKERSKSSHRSSSDRKKSKNLERHQSSPESESESKRKRHKKDHRNESRRSGGYEDLEDGELVLAR